MSLFDFDDTDDLGDFADFEHDDLDLLSEPYGGAVGATPSAALRNALSRPAARQALKLPDRFVERVSGGMKRLQAMLKALADRQRDIAARLRTKTSDPAGARIYLGATSRRTDNGAPIPPGATRTISVEATEPLEIRGLLVNPHDAVNFQISRIQIARTNLLAGSHPVPSSIFSCRSFLHPRMQTPRLAANTSVDIEVINISASPRHFSAAFEAIDLTVRDCA